MSDEPLTDCTNDELERRLNALESEEWLGALKDLKPFPGVDLYAIGFEAGKQSVWIASQAAKPPAESVWLHTRTALCSSAVSVAATLLLMVTLTDGLSRRTITPVQTEVAVQSNLPASPVGKAPMENDQVKVPANAVQPTMPDVNEVFERVPRSWSDRLQSVALKVPDRDDSPPVVDIEPSRLRYAYQRRQLAENFGFNRN